MTPLHKSILLILMICLIFTKGGPRCAAQEPSPAPPEPVPAALLKMVSADIDSFEKIKPYQGFSEYYPYHKAEYTGMFLESLPEEEGIDAAAVISLAERGFLYAKEIREPYERERQIAEAQMRIALALDKWDHGKAVELAEKIRGPQTRERALVKLGVAPYKDVPAQPAKKIAYFRSVAAGKADPVEKARLLLKAMEAIGEMGIQDGIRSYYAYDFVDQEKLDFLPELGRTDRRLACEFIESLRKVRKLAVNRGSSALEYRFAEVDIRYIDDLAAVDLDEAFRQAQALKSGSYISSDGLRAAALMSLAGIAASKDRGRAKEIYLKARGAAEKGGRDAVEAMEAQTGIKLNVPFEIICLPEKPSKNEALREKTFPSTFPALMEQIKKSIRERSRYAVIATRCMPLHEVYQQWADKDQLFRFVKEWVVPEVEKLEIDKNSPKEGYLLKITWYSGLAVIFKDRGLSEAMAIMKKGMDLVGEYPYQDDDAITSAVLAFIECDLKGAEQFVIERLSPVSSPNYDAAQLFIRLYDLDPLFVMNFLNTYPAHYMTWNRGVLYKQQGHEDIEIGDEFYRHAALQIARSQETADALAFISRYPALSAGTWSPAFSHIAKADPEALFSFTGSTDKPLLAMGAALAGAEKDEPRSLEILKALKDPSLQVQAAERLARMKKPGAALELARSIADVRYRLAAVYVMVK
ncbi:MAG: hypothetical protein RDV48_25455 [Candidatus Eremiobacteraeota bacterium]|nr:hypothetical protein [Candidatus Eremiobacteraeota bacterium]